MSITGDTFISAIATEFPATVKVFQRRGIDFCCGGNRPLRAATEEGAGDLDGLIAELETALRAEPAPATDWRTAPLSALVRHIRDTYHQPQPAELERIEALMAKVLRVHRDRWGDMLVPLSESVATMAHELIWHTQDEEERLFPAILALELNEPATLRGGGLDRFLERLEHDHASVGALLADIEKRTDGFTPPRDGCATFRALFEELRAFDLRLKEHVHLENHILFPRAAALGRRIADGNSVCQL
ncbi:MAG TPA: DUF542 domain-containing protein [Vicinamibacterales bacterium]|nr:DUF542 domain-containing protein [Vicinamibacterales bacterium]